MYIPFHSVVAPPPQIKAEGISGSVIQHKTMRSGITDQMWRENEIKIIDNNTEHMLGSDNFNRSSIKISTM